MRQKLRTIAKMMFAWTMILLVLGIVVELFFQIKGWVSSDDSDRVEHIANESFGTWRTPNQENRTWKGECFETTDISTNSLGMRSAEPNPDKKVKVGWFGDSMIQGYEVAKEDHWLYRLNESDKTRDHLNFSIAATGTIAQLENFLFHADSIDLDEVVLCMYLSNDVWNNSYEISVTDGWEYDKPLPYLRIDDEGGYYVDRSQIEWHNSWCSSLYTVRFFDGLFHNLGKKWSYKSDFDPYSYSCEGIEEIVPFNHQRYIDGCKHPWWTDALDYTEYALYAFVEECQMRDIDFSVVLIPCQEDFIPKAERAKALAPYGDLLNTDREYDYFKEIFEANDISYLNLIDIGRKKVKKENIPSPYFSLVCDMHFSKLGHDLLYESVKRWKR